MSLVAVPQLCALIVASFAATEAGCLGEPITLAGLGAHCRSPFAALRLSVPQYHPRFQLLCKDIKVAGRVEGPQHDYLSYCNSHTIPCVYPLLHGRKPALNPIQGGPYGRFLKGGGVMVSNFNDRLISDHD